MTRQHTTLSSLVRRLRPSPERFAAAAALQDPNLLLQYRAAQGHDERPPARGRGALRSAIQGETGGAVLLVAAVALALLWSKLIGLLTNAYEPRSDGPAAISPNDRIQHRLHPWTSKVVVPMFALANAGLHVDHQLLVEAATSPITWGIILAYVAGKPLGIVIAAAAAGRRRGRDLGDLRGAAISTGVGFTVSLLIASRAFDGALLDQAKVGILATALLAPALAVAALAPRTRRAVAMTPCPAR